MWSLEGSMACWQSPDAQMRVDAKRPDQGLHEIRWRGSMLPELRLLRVSSISRGDEDHQLEDVYVRGQDVVASYAETDRNPVHMQVYWRISPPPDGESGVVLEAIVSAQTPLLDSDPRVEISSVLSGRDWHTLRAAADEGACESLAVDAERPCVLAPTADSALVLARLPGPGGGQGPIVAARQGRLLATAFHPELAADDRFHRLFVSLARGEA